MHVLRVSMLSFKHKNKSNHYPSWPCLQWEVACNMTYLRVVKCLKWNRGTDAKWVLSTWVLFLFFHKLGGCRLWKTADRGRLARWALGLELPHAPDTLPPSDRHTRTGNKTSKWKKHINIFLSTAVPHQWDTSIYRKLRFTSFPELGVAVVTHFGHPVFEVLQWVSVPGTSTAHHLHRDTVRKEDLQTKERQHPVSVGLFLTSWQLMQRQIKSTLLH